jgi:hypothetical protein
MDGHREPRLEWPSPDVLSRPFTNRGRRQRRYAGSCLIVPLPTWRPATDSTDTNHAVWIHQGRQPRKNRTFGRASQISFIGTAQ